MKKILDGSQVKDTATTKTSTEPIQRAVMDRGKLVREGGLSLPSPMLLSSDAYKKAPARFPVPRAAVHGSTNQASPASKEETSGDQLLPHNRTAHGLVNRLGFTCATKVFTPS